MIQLRMEAEASRFTVPLGPVWTSRTLYSWKGLATVALSGTLAWLASRLGFDPMLAVFLAGGAIVGTQYLSRPSHLILGVDGTLVVWPLRRTLFPWAHIAAVELDAANGNFRRPQALLLTLTDRRTLRIRASMPRLSLDRVERFINTRLRLARPALPNVLARLETSRQAAGALLENPGGLVYRDESLPRNEWWRLLESTWAKPHERVAAALALGADAYAAHQERVETLLGCFASKPLSRITRQAFAVEHPDEAHRLLKSASALAAPRRWLSRWR